jgi:protein TonB
MPLRCLLFATDEGMVQPIWQVLADLDIEGELCQSAVDAVEKVTTHLFQILVTDWEDQPEASFLLKTARDQKAANRPLTLAIVGDESRLPEALRAGANSVLLKPLRPEQIRETMKTACELIRAKQTASAPRVSPLEKAIATQAPALRVPTPASEVKLSSAASLNRETDKNFRAGEFLHTSNSAPGAQFDTESDIQKSINEAEASTVEVDALTELEPMAAEVTEVVSTKPRGNREALTGWASLQSRLTRSEPQTAFNAETSPEMPTGVEEPLHSDAPALVLKPKPAEVQAEADLHAYMSGGQGEQNETAISATRASSSRPRMLVLAAVGITVAAVLAIPATGRKLRLVSRRAATAAISWLNPKPVPLPQVATQHDSFGQDGDEYKLPGTGNIPDATTDPSQIHVVPVIDPTVKAEKNSDADGGKTAGAADPNQPGGNPTAGPSADGGATVDQSASLPTKAGGQQMDSPSPVVQTQLSVPTSSQNSPAEPVRPKPVSLQNATLPNTSAMASTASIPSSLRSQVASMTPEASGAKPVEAAMSSIEPVALPEASVRNLLDQGVNPQYPAGAKAGGQSGSVILQVLITHDGTVQDAKFLQGSLMFANAAIDAVKLWRFKPYLLNGRPVSVQSTITLNFKPPA